MKKISVLNTEINQKIDACIKGKFPEIYALIQNQNQKESMKQKERIFLSSKIVSNNSKIGRE